MYEHKFIIISVYEPANTHSQIMSSMKYRNACTCTSGRSEKQSFYKKYNCYMTITSHHIMYKCKKLRAQYVEELESILDILNLRYSIIPSRNRNTAYAKRIKNMHRFVI